MLYSEIKDCGGVPTLYINGKAYPSAAYMTYLEKFNDYKNFVDAGYNMFSVPVLFSGRWVSITDGFTPFKKGIFDKKGKPDFSLFDEAIEKILTFCPDAYILPRVNMCMPVWWENENPDGVNLRADGTSMRESFYSVKWRNDASVMLKDFVNYVNNSRYASYIAGYQIAGGNTEEWFHFDLNGGLCKNAENGFKTYLSRYYPETVYKGVPDLSALDKNGGFHNDVYLAIYLEYVNFAVADAIKSFARIVKDETDNNVVVGTFYGYSLEVVSPLWGTHALKLLLEDDNIDFICSPNSYAENRSLTFDHTEMYPADSVRLHGKMCFQECDIRTYLTVPLCEKDPATDPGRILTAPIWYGPATLNESVSAVRKSFCRQLIKGNGFWWFDMWGGWYDDCVIMNEMSRFKDIYTHSLKSENRKSVAEVAVFSDESAYKYMTCSHLRNAVFLQRKSLGFAGTPYDMYDLFDFEKVYKNYKAVIIASPVETGYYKNAVGLCEKHGVGLLRATPDEYNFPVSRIRSFLKKNGVHIYCETDDIVYINSDFVSVIAVSDGEKNIRLKQSKKVTPLFDGNADCVVTDNIKIRMKKGEVMLFKTE